MDLYVNHLGIGLRGLSFLEIQAKSYDLKKSTKATSSAGIKPAFGLMADFEEKDDIIVDEEHDRRYKKCRVLGKGGFGTCFEILDLRNRERLACKIIPKGSPDCFAQLERVRREIRIHGRLRHNHIVRLQHSFEDFRHLYIVMELCEEKTLQHLLRQRGVLTEPEVRYFMKQIAEAVSFIHQQQIVHRDVKLSNLLLTSSIEVKLADFGLSCHYDDALYGHKSVCGTPNYMAPEMLDRREYGFQVDIWAMGCVMYTLLVGKAPFESDSLKDVYSKVRNNEYSIPSKVSRPATALVQRLLSEKPQRRPGLEELLGDEFFVRGFMPAFLPPTCFFEAPVFPLYSDTPPGYGNGGGGGPWKADKLADKCSQSESGIDSQDSHHSTSDTNDPVKCWDTQAPMYFIGRLRDTLNTTNPKPNSDLNSIPTSKEEPKVWITRWIDYSDRYGFGVYLSNGSVVVVFKDFSVMVLSGNKRRLQYYDYERNLFRFSTTRVPDHLAAKKAIVENFTLYMEKYLMKGSNLECADLTESPDEADLPILSYWLRTDKAILLCLSNGTVQVNFFSDHTKVILTPGSSCDYVTYIDESRNSHVHGLGPMYADRYPHALRARLLFCLTLMSSAFGLCCCTQSSCGCPAVEPDSRRL